MEQQIIPTDLLMSGAKELGVELSEGQVRDMSRFVALLLEWNQKFNLTRITDPEEIVVKHLLDSLTCLKAVEFPENASVIDVGTGGGLPGIPLKIARPDLEMTFLDATRKKLTFIEAVVRDLGMERAFIIHGRAEDVGQDLEMRERFRMVVSRAVGDMRVLAEYTVPFARVGGYVVAQKGPDVEDELAHSKKGISTLGGRIVKVEKLTVPHSDLGRTLVVIEKQSPTPKRYPRRQAEIAQKPL